MPEKIEEILPEEQPKEEAPKEEAEIKEEGETPKAPEKIKIGDQEFTIDQIQEALKAAEDYKYLVPEFTRKSQRLAELERKLEGLTEIEEKIEDPAKAEAKRILKELGFVTVEDAREVVGEAIKTLQEDIELEQVLQYLEDKYNGEKGEPKFDREEVMNYALENYGDMERVDLEYIYKKMHEDYWGRIPEKPTPKAVRTERGGRTTFTLPQKKITFRGEKKGETSVEEAAKELLKERQAFEEGEEAI